MGRQSKLQLLRALPWVMGATFAVAVCPVLASWWLGGHGVTSQLLLALVGMALSLGASVAGDKLWRARTGVHDLLFKDLMLWGWLYRWHTERVLANATRILGLDGRAAAAGGEAVSPKRRSEVLSQLAAKLEGGDAYTHGHSRRVARHAAMIAKQMGLTPAAVAKVRTAAAVHDVGKMRTPLEVLRKPGALSEEEFTILKRHPDDGAEMAATLGDAELTAMVRHHHERLDGTGYPSRLAGDAIPLGARIIAVADTFDALTSVRPYRGAQAHKKAIAILTTEAGTRLEPAAVEAFCACYGGRRPLAMWAVAVNVPQRVAAWLSGGLHAASASSVAGLATTVAATAAISGSAATIDAHRHPAPTVAVAHRALAFSVRAIPPRTAGFVPTTYSPPVSYPHIPAGLRNQGFVVLRSDPPTSGGRVAAARPNPASNARVVPSAGPGALSTGTASSPPTVSTATATTNPPAAAGPGPSAAGNTGTGSGKGRRPVGSGAGSGKTPPGHGKGAGGGAPTGGHGKGAGGGKGTGAGGAGNGKGKGKGKGSGTGTGGTGTGTGTGTGGTGTGSGTGAGSGTGGTDSGAGGTGTGTGNDKETGKGKDKGKGAGGTGTGTGGTGAGTGTGGAGTGTGGTPPGPSPGPGSVAVIFLGLISLGWRRTHKLRTARRNGRPNAAGQVIAGHGQRDVPRAERRPVSRLPRQRRPSC
jgi:putative nucleotidyltransferase with HDIG domain